MMNVEHIIAKSIAPPTAEVFAQICADGELRPRRALRSAGEHGRTFALDHLAGDTEYLFLAYSDPRYGSRYRQSLPPEHCYGFQFPVSALKGIEGVLVGDRDLLPLYDDALESAINEVLPHLPPLLPDDEAVAEFLARFGDAPLGMEAALRESTTSRYWEIWDAVEAQDFSVLGVEEVMPKFISAVAQLQQKYRRPLAEARITPQCEVLVPCPLPLSLCYGFIEQCHVVSPRITEKATA
jgi:hypothetical protein